jgi:hypothetical protein
MSECDLKYYKTTFGMELKISGFSSDYPYRSLKKDFNFDKELFLSYLKKEIIKDIDISKFPTSFIVAGGYLLGKAVEFLKISKNNHGDIDIFQVFHMQSEEDKKDTDFNEFLEQEHDLYKFFIKGDDYEIIGDRREGELNIIKVTTSMNFNWKKIIEDFDLNATKIGLRIDKSSWELYVSDEFLDFLSSREIISTVNGYCQDGTFFRSFSRMLIKKDQYPWINFNENLFFQVAVLQDSHWFHEKEINLKSLGSEKIKRLSSYIKNIPYFDIVGDKFTIIHKQQEYKEHSRLFIEYLVKEGKIFLSKSELRRLLRIVPFVERKIRKSDNEYIPKSVIVHLDLLKFDIKDEELFHLSKLYNHNCNRKVTELLKLKKNWKEAMRFVRELNKNPNLIAFLESAFILRKDLENNSSIEGLIRLRNKWISKNHNYNYTPLRTLFIYDKYIRELTSEKDLQEEAYRMKHCVSGYWNNILKGSEIIFHLEFEGEHSTFSIRRIHRHLYISQHKSKNNGDPSKRSYLVSKLFLNYLKHYDKTDRVLK